MYEKSGAIIYAIIKPLLGIVFSGRLRTRVLIVHDSDVLLLRNWIGKQDWSIPGGGVKRGENPEKALSREVHEELGLDIQEGSLNYLIKQEHNEDNVKYPVIIYSLTIKQKPSLSVSHPEIIEAKWFNVKKLPKSLNDLVNNAISVYSSKHKG